jgi:hypothetical protein
MRLRLSNNMCNQADRDTYVDALEQQHAQSSRERQQVKTHFDTLVQKLENMLLCCNIAARKIQAKYRFPACICTQKEHMVARPQSNYYNSCPANLVIAAGTTQLQQKEVQNCSTKQKNRNSTILATTCTQKSQAKLHARQTSHTW